MLSAGTNVEWLRDDLGLIATAAESHDVASRCETSDGVIYVPALLGPRHAPLGLRRAAARCSASPAAASDRRSCAPSSRASRSAGADLVEAAEHDTGLAIPSLRVDGGMTDNPTFVQALADATQRPVEVSPVKEATTLGAAFLAGLAVGHVERLGRHRRHLAAAPHRRAGRAARPRAVGRSASTAPPGGSPSSPPSRSDRPHPRSASGGLARLRRSGRAHWWGR